MRKSRRLALKRRRQQRERRTSVADILHLTPTRRHGNDLAQEAAEQLALTAAINDDQLTVGANLRKSRTKRSSRNGRRESTLADYPLPSDSEVAAWFTTEESEGKKEQPSTATSEAEEPTTADRRFIKPSWEKESDDEYVLTDSGELDYELSEAENDFFKYPEKYVREGHVTESKNTAGEMFELDTKVGDDADEADDAWLRHFTPPPLGSQP